MSYNVAIDGPAGAGKSTIAKRIAKEKGFIYVDTGAMYRAMALHMLRENVSPEDTAAVAEECEGVDITIRYEGGEQHVFLNGEDVNGLIRTEEVSQTASKTSVVRRVRERLVSLQQEMARSQDVVMDGRDIGTKVLPDADLKIFLTASVSVRAGRRFDELKAKGMSVSLSEIEDEIRERDERDMTREESPLVQAPDAVLVDTSDLNIDEVVEKILAMIK
ncbi:MAG: (d)CMP kinase [Lachnospiraceae bacterium]|nr:(d)CMP kinase [Lachnospiraceae bacterium]